MERWQEGMIWYASSNHRGWLNGQRFSIDEPCTTVAARGLRADALSHWHLEQDDQPDRERPMDPHKPPYQPLLMAAVHAAPFSGLTHVSTFSGGGGTCLGFRLAGFKTLFANDLEQHARRSYRANLDSPIDGRDIRYLTAEAILERTGLAVGELDVFEGSPPCTAFSTAGKRDKGWGQTKTHAGLTQANVEDLFYEWLRLLDGLRPRAFVAENVSGMVKGTAKGYFKDVLRKMTALGYRTEAGMLDAQWLGVPQRRARLIFIGIREDLEATPRFPAPLPYRYSVRDALPWLTGASFDPRGQYSATPEFVDHVCPTVIVNSPYHFLVQDGTMHRQWRSGDEPSPTVMAGRVTNVQMEGTSNAPFDRKGERVSLDAVSPAITAQRHNVALVEQIIGNEAFSPRFGTLDEAHPTIMTASGKTSGGLRVNGQRRKFLIAELKRICSFPDDYALTGTYGQQWARLGNSVPPLMAYAIGSAVRDVLLEVDARKKAPTLGSRRLGVKG
jgi:DNA (cytosine-5)-methyltransferase 1